MDTMLWHCQIFQIINTTGYFDLAGKIEGSSEAQDFSMKLSSLPETKTLIGKILTFRRQ